MKDGFGKKNLWTALKIAIGSSGAMFIAMELGLENAISAGTIALLTIVTTKWETMRLSMARIITFAFAVVLAIMIFPFTQVHWAIYGIYIFFLVVISEYLGWKATISVNAVIGAHFLVSRNFSPEFIWNEFMLVLIGTAMALVVNLFSHNQYYRKKLVVKIEYVEGKLQEILTELAGSLKKREIREDVWQDIRELEAALRKLVVEASEYEGNTLRSHTGYYMSYFEMRLDQCNVLHDLHYEINKIRKMPAQAEIIADYMLYMRDYLPDINSASEQIEKLEEIIQTMKEQPLPISQDEFEARAILYHVLSELESFLVYKKRFVKKLDETQKRLYWKENKS